jgi:hypothetical protein
MNAKQELRNELINISKEVSEILWAAIGNKNKIFKLNPEYTPKELEEFIENLNFEYDNGYGGQELYGIIAFNDNTWFDRYEYDGSESWDYHKFPTFENSLKEISDEYNYL